MKLTLNEKTDTAILVLDDLRFPRDTALTYSCGPEDEDRQIALHFDKEGVLLGVKIDGAKRLLPPELALAARWDKVADAADIELTRVGAGQLRKNHGCDPLKIRAMIFLGFDQDNRLMDIEVLDASRFLPPSVLAAATIIG